MSNPSEFSYLNRLWAAPFPADNVMPLGAYEGFVELTGFVEGSFAGQKHTNINDSGQDSPGNTTEHYPGMAGPMSITATFRFNRFNFAVLLNLLPGTYRIAPAMGRILVQGATPGGILVRTFGFVDMPEMAKIPLDGKMETQIEISGSGKPLFYIPGEPIPPPPLPPAAVAEQPAPRTTTSEMTTGARLPGT